MRFSSFLISTLVAGAYAAPALPFLDLEGLANPGTALDALSGYFNLVASKIKSSKTFPAAPKCDLSKAQMPGTDILPPPSPGLTVRHVALGRGTQNYTCNLNKPDAAPKAVGAVATLFDVSCAAALYPPLLEKMTNMAVNFEIQDGKRLGPAILPVSGHHWFSDSTTPYFDLNAGNREIGVAPCGKDSSAQAPTKTVAIGRKGEAAVPWLKLVTKSGATGNIKEVYRVNTAGGSPPATCKGMPVAFEVQYATIYWFWQS